jgi:hypothetical protein
MENNMYIRDYNKTDFQKKLISMSRDEFDKFMCEKFPMLFAQRDKPMTETGMCWGFDVGKGWYPLLHEMCEKIMLICDAYNWRIEFVQIKEKYGSGRFYFDSMSTNDSIDPDKANVIDELINDIVHNYEEISGRVCAETGKWYDDTISLGGWVYDCCAESIIERYPERKEAVESALERMKKIKEIKNSLSWCKDEALDKILNDINNEV